MKLRGILAGILVLPILLMCLIFASVGSASNILETIAVDFYAVKKIIIDNVDKTPPSDQAPFVYNGSTYVPLRYISEALGKPVNWDGSTGTIYIGGSPNLVKTNVIYDDFTQPLSLNWDVAHQAGTWSIDQYNGAYCNDGGNFLPLNTGIYDLPEKYEIECELTKGAGIFLKGKNSTNYDDFGVDDPYHIYLERYYTGFYVYSYQGSHRINDLGIEDGKYYNVKFVVNKNTIDIYLDNKFVFSEVIPEGFRVGSAIGLFSENKSGYIKSFKITM